MSTTKVTLGKRVSALLVSILVASVTDAQELAGSGNADDDTLEEVVVTGSRIRRAGFDTLQPALQMDSELMDAKGYENVANAINVVPTFGIPGSSNSGGQGVQNVGQNFVNALGVGSSRTLTLINGRRVVGQSTPTVVGNTADLGLQVDLNIIPTALIERIETVFIGGAPSYGSDAIGGTVNIILKDNFEGLTLEGQYGLSEKGDAETYRLRSLAGANFSDDRGNVTLAVEYNHVDGLLGIDRQDVLQGAAFCDNPANTGPSDGIPDRILCTDGQTIWSTPNVGAPLPSIGLWNGPIGGDNSFFDAQGNSLLFSLDGQSLIPATPDIIGNVLTNPFFSQGAGFGNPYVTSKPDTNSIISPLERWLIGANGHYDINSNVRFVVEGLFARSQSEDEVNQPFWGESDFGPGSNGVWQLPLSNPYLNPAVAGIIDSGLRTRDLDGDGLPDDDPNLIDSDGDGIADTPGFYFTQAHTGLSQGGRPNFRDQNVFRIVAGLEGEAELLGSTWFWDATYNIGQTDSNTHQSMINGPRVAYALDAVVDPVTSEIVCAVQLNPPVASGQNTTFGQPFQPSDVTECVPLNPFGVRALSPEQAEYFLQQRFQATQLRQTVFEANVAGTPISLPSGDIGIAFGYTQRTEDGRFDVDQASHIGIDPGDPIKSVSGSYDTRELYAEASIPLLVEGSRWDIPGVSLLQFEGAVRHVDNSQSGNAVTWTAGGRFRPILPWFDDGLLLRGNFTHAIRSPSIAESFLPRSRITTFADDPCDPEFIGQGNNASVRTSNCMAAVSQLQASGTLPATFDLDNFQSLIVNAALPAWSSGNRNLVNEEADSWTAGLVVTPPSIEGLTVAIDYSNIEIDDAIVSLRATQLLVACYDSPGFPNESACNRFSRNPNTFQIVEPETGFVNAATRKFSGWIVDGSYVFDADKLPFLSGEGQIELSGTWFKTNEQSQTVTGFDQDDFTNEHGFEDIKWQFNLRYFQDRYSVLYQPSFISGGVYNNADSPESKEVNGYDSSLLHNLSLTFRANDNLSLRFIVNNLFDETDSIRRMAGSPGNTNRFVDVIGRRFQLAVTADF